MKKVAILLLLVGAFGFAGCHDDDNDGGGGVVPPVVPQYVTCLLYDSDNPRFGPIRVEPGRYDNPATICVLRLCEIDDQCFWGCPPDLMQLDCPHR